MSVDHLPSGARWSKRGSVGRFVSSWVTVGLIIFMMTSVVGGFVYISQMQTQLFTLRDLTRDMRRARQAVMEADGAVLNTLAITTATPDLAAYYAAESKLESHPPEHFPKTIRRQSGDVASTDVVMSLRAGWGEAMAKAAIGDLEAARRSYTSRQMRSQMRDLVTTFFVDLDVIETEYNALLKRIQLTTSAVLLLQILTGAVCIIAFVLASRSTGREAKARALAVTSANSSREQVMRLFEMTDMLQSATDYADADAVLRSTAVELLPGFGGALYVFNNSRDRLTLSTSWQLPDGMQLPDTIGLPQCWALKRGKPHYNNSQSHKLCCEHHAGGDFALEIPMSARGEILGLLQIHAEGSDGLRRLEQISGVGSALSDAMSLALSNIALRDKLRSQALRDPLTGLYNRRYMEDALHRVIRLAERDGHEVSVIMIDLDHFKRLNDQYGHAKGDSVLRDTASAIMGQLRESDVACRYGGEELIVVMPSCGLEAAAEKAERIRLAIRALSESGGAQVSASVGVACIPSTSSTGKDLLAASDAALYQAKQAGRDRVARAPLLSAVPDDAKDQSSPDDRPRTLPADRMMLVAAE